MSEKEIKNPTSRMPILFVGHGSPMNAIENNSFTQMLTQLEKKIPKPKAVLVISAHWLTNETWVLGMQSPKTIHDFYGFPQELFEVQYPAQGSPETAESIANSILNPIINLDLDKWGMDHGSWSILRHMYPDADIPVIQMSLDLSRPLQFHFNLGQQLLKFRDQGVLIIGSGNIVHNLRRMIWSANAQPHNWAVEFDDWVKTKLLARDFFALINDFHKSEAGQQSIPTLEHYLPLLYIIGAADLNDELFFEFEELHYAAISMRTFGFWPKKL